MALFEYKAVSPSGETLQGTMEAVSVENVIARLQEQGNIPLQARPSGEGLFSLSRLKFGRQGLNTREVGEFTQQLSTLLGAGLPLDRSLQVLTELAPNDRSKRCVADIRDRVREGGSLSEALEAVTGEFIGSVYRLRRRVVLRARTAAVYREAGYPDVTVSVVKAQNVVDLSGGAEALPGATITYTITVEVTNSATATASVVNDPIPTFTTFAPGSITLNGAAITDAADADAGEYDISGAPMIVVRLGDLTQGDGIQTVVFEVTVD